MARLYIVDSARRSPGFLSIGYESDYVVERDDGSETKWFEDYESAKAYESFLQEKDDREKMIRSLREIQESSERREAEYIRNNAEKEKMNQRMEQMLRIQQSAERREFLRKQQLEQQEQQRKKEEEEKKKAEQEREREILEFQWQQREANLKGMALVFCPKIDSGEIEYDKEKHDFYIWKVLCDNLYYFQNRCLAVECQIVSAKSVLVLLKNYHLTPQELNKIFTRMLVDSAKNGYYSLDDLFNGISHDPLLFMHFFSDQDALNYYGARRWEECVSNLLKEKGIKFFRIIDSGKWDAIRAKIIEDAIKKCSTCLWSWEDNLLLALFKTEKYFQLVGDNFWMKELCRRIPQNPAFRTKLNSIRNLPLQFALLVKIFQLPQMESQLPYRTELKRLDKIRKKLQKIRNEIAEDERIVNDFPKNCQGLIGVLNYNVSSLEPYNISCKRMTTIRDEVRTKLAQKPDFSEMKARIDAALTEVEDVMRDIRAWTKTNFIEDNALTARSSKIKIIRKSPSLSPSYIEECRSALWNYVGLIIQCRENIENAPKGFWFSSKRKEIKELLAQNDALFQVFAPMAIIEKNEDITDYTNFVRFMKSLDPSLTFTKGSDGQRMMGICKGPQA